MMNQDFRAPQGAEKIAKLSIMPSIGPFERLSGDRWIG